MKNSFLALLSALALVATSLGANSTAWAAATAQTADQFRTSKLVGSKVYNANNEKR
jgi:hypothetical protein